MRFLAALLLVFGFVNLVAAMLNHGPRERRRAKVAIGLGSLVLGFGLVVLLSAVTYEVNTAIRAERERTAPNPVYASTAPTTGPGTIHVAPPTEAELRRMNGSDPADGNGGRPSADLFAPTSLLGYAAAGGLVFGFYRLVLGVFGFGPRDRRADHLRTGTIAFGLGLAALAAAIVIPRPEPNAPATAKRSP